MEPAEEGQEDRFLRKDHPRGQSRGRHQVRKSACLQPMHSEAASPPSVESAVMVQWVSTPVYPLQSRQNDGRSWTNVPEALVTSELPSSSDTAPFFFFFYCSILNSLLHLRQLSSSSQTLCLLLPAWCYFLWICWNFSPSGEFLAVVFYCHPLKSRLPTSAGSRAGLVATQSVSRDSEWGMSAEAEVSQDSVKATKM